MLAEPTKTVSGGLWCYRSQVLLQSRQTLLLITKRLPTNVEASRTAEASQRRRRIGLEELQIAFRWPVIALASVGQLVGFVGGTLDVLAVQSATLATAREFSFVLVSRHLRSASAMLLSILPSSVLRLLWCETCSAPSLPNTRLRAGACERLGAWFVPTFAIVSISGTRRAELSLTLIGLSL